MSHVTSHSVLPLPGWNCDSISQVNVPMVSKVEKVVEIPQVQYIR